MKHLTTDMVSLNIIMTYDRLVFAIVKGNESSGIFFVSLPSTLEKVVYCFLWFTDFYCHTRGVSQNYQERDDVLQSLSEVRNILSVAVRINTSDFQDLFCRLLLSRLVSWFRLIFLYIYIYIGIPFL